MANIITLIRFPLLFLYVGLLYTNNPTLQLWDVPFIILIILLDTVDGVIARSRGEVSLIGSVLDIATDRTLEIVLWVVFAHLGLIPIVIPLIVIARGTTVDAIRAVGMRSGVAAFDQVQAPISRFLVSSKYMRSGYGFAKGIAFSMLTLDLGLLTKGCTWQPTVHFIALIFTWIAISMNIARGLPVLIEGYSLFKNPPPITKNVNEE
ncbi:MAG TPA: CDP-alcohol phosphatidyltransferase family protein [Anaerolineae bacterium]|nr:CDP-alcohol phosphatidyltransferase family protein [Anaerolineae bacterium]